MQTVHCSLALQVKSKKTKVKRARGMADNRPGGVVAAASELFSSKDKKKSFYCQRIFHFLKSVWFCVIEQRLQVVKGLVDVEVSECQSCSLEVTLNLAYIEGTWTRDGLQLRSKPSCQISTHGKKHSLILKRVALVDAGLFAFQADGIQTSGRLSVRGKTFPHV